MDILVNDWQTLKFFGLKYFWHWTTMPVIILNELEICPMRPQMTPYDLQWPKWRKVAHMISNDPMGPHMNSNGLYDLKWPYMT